MWFHLMPYPALPEEFNKQHRSVWVDIDPSLFDRDILAETYDSYIDQLVFAESCGFDSICVNEHHNNGYGLMPSPNLIAAVLANRTSKVAITVLGNSVALYNPPVRIAEEFAMLDLFSRGRLIAGFPVGTPMDTCYSYGVNPSQLRPKYYEGIELIRQAWTSSEPFAFNGEFNKHRYVNPVPRPYQQPHPPIWIPGGGSIETWDYCAENDFVYGALTYYGAKFVRETVGGYWNRVEAHGKDYNPNRLAVTQFVGVADTDAEAYRLYKEPAEYFFNRSLHVYPGFTDPPGYVTEASVRARYKSQVRNRGARQAGRARPELRRDGRQRLRRARRPRHRARAARGGDQGAQHREPVRDAPVRQHERRADAVQHAAVRREGGARNCAACSPTGSIRTGRRTRRGLIRVMSNTIVYLPGHRRRRRRVPCPATARR